MKGLLLAFIFVLTAGCLPAEDVKAEVSALLKEQMKRGIAEIWMDF